MRVHGKHCRGELVESIERGGVPTIYCAKCEKVWPYNYSETDRVYVLYWKAEWNGMLHATLGLPAEAEGYDRVRWGWGT